MRLNLAIGLPTLESRQPQLTQQKNAHNHIQRLNEYGGWQQVFAANPESRQSLDIDDWLFFFGKE